MAQDNQECVPEAAVESESGTGPVIAGKPSVLTRVRVWCGLGAAIVILAAFIVNAVFRPRGDLMDVLFLIPFAILAVVWFLLCFWQGLVSLMRQGFWGSFRTPTAQRWFHYLVFGLVVAAPVAVFWWIYSFLLPRVCLMADQTGIMLAERMKVLVVSLCSLHGNGLVLLLPVLGVLALLIEWRLAARPPVRARIFGMAVVALIVWGIAGWLTFETAVLGFQVSEGLSSRNSTYQAMLAEISLLSQADARYAAKELRLQELLAGKGGYRSGVHRVADAAELSDEDCRHQIQFLKLMAGSSQDAAVRSRAVATLLLLRERVERDFYLASEVLNLVNQLTGEQFETLADADEWVKGKAGDPNWAPLSLLSFGE